MPGRWRKAGLAVGWGIIAGWLPMALALANAYQSSDGSDFGMYYAAAETLRFSPHANIYSIGTLTATVLTHGGCALPLDGTYPYQPLLALLLEPLTLLRCQDAASVWRYFNFVLWFGVAALFTVRSWRRHSASRALLVAMMTVFFLPILSGIHFGQVHIVLLVCLICGIALIERGHELAGGAALGFAIVLKYFPAIIVFYYLLRGRWRAAAEAAITSLALLVAEILIVGPQTLLDSIGGVQRDVRYYAALFEGTNWMSSLPGGVAGAYLAGIVFVVVVGWLQWRGGYSAVNGYLGASWALATVLLLSPLVWWSYMTWLLPALVVCLDLALRFARRTAVGRDWRARAVGWAPAAALVVSYGLLEIPAYNTGAANYRTAAAGTLLLWLLCGALYVWSAGVRLPWAPLRHAKADEATGPALTVEATPR